MRIPGSQICSNHASGTKPAKAKVCGHGKLEHMAAPKTQKQQVTAIATPTLKKRTRILLADDHPVVRKGIALCLKDHERLEVVGEAADGHEALRKAKELLPDVILMDVDMPGLSGLTAVEALRKELPKVKVLLLSMSNN